MPRLMFLVTYIFVNIFGFLAHCMSIFKKENSVYQYQGSHKVKMHDIFKLCCRKIKDGAP